MTTQYTPILQLALPVTGELNGTWGDVVNNNITSMIEQAIAGAATINTWTGASHTLTTANGTTDEARCAMLICSGTPGAAATVICPALTKVYIVTNNVAGGYAVTIKTSAGTGISVSNGTTALVYCDGTNVVAAGPDVVTSTGVVNTSSGGTGQSTYSNGQLLIGKTDGTLAKATLTQGSGVTITNGDGSISISATGSGGTVTSVGGTGTVNGISLSGTVTSSGNLTLGGTLSGVNLTTQVTGTLPVANGGTGQTTTQAAINSLAGAVTSGYYLRGNGTNVSMSALSASDISGAVAITNGGTGQTTASAAFNALSPITTTGDLILGNGTNSATRLGIGTNGQVLTSNGTTASWQSISGGAGSISKTSSGSITAGSGVIINADGTVSQPTFTSGINLQTTELISTGTYRGQCVYCTSVGAYILVYIRTSDSYLCGKIGTPNSTGETISWGTETVFISTACGSVTNVVWDNTAAKFFIACVASSPTYVAGSLTSSAISIGTAVSPAGNYNNGYIAYDPNTSKAVIAFINGTTALGRVGTYTLSGNNLTSLSSFADSASPWYEPKVYYFPKAGKCVVLCRYNSNYLYGSLITTSTSTPTIDSLQLLSSSLSSPYSLAFGYASSSSPAVTVATSTVSGIKFAILDVSGATLSVSGITTAPSTSTSVFNIVYDSAASLYAIAYLATSTSYPTYNYFTLSGSTITLNGTPTTLNSTTASYISIAFNTAASNMLSVYSSSTTGFYYRTIKDFSTTLTSTNYLGVAASTVSTGQAVTVTTIGGVNTNQTGLTPAATYYVSGSGALSTAGSILAGTALTSSSILLRN